MYAIVTTSIMEKIVPLRILVVSSSIGTRKSVNLVNHVTEFFDNLSIILLLILLTIPDKRMAILMMNPIYWRILKNYLTLNNGRPES